MTLEQQVTNLELSKKLKELGVPQRSLFYFMRADDKYTKESGSLRYGLTGYYGLNTEPYVLGMAGHVGLANCIDSYSAFTVAELGEMLPAHIAGYKGNFDDFVCYNDSNVLKVEASFTAASEADARAKMLIYLLENKLITL